MTVAELVAILSSFDQDAQVMIHDADTGWALPLHHGIHPHHCKPSVGSAVLLYGLYDEAICE